MPNESIAIQVESGKVDVRLGHPESPAAVLTGKADLILQLLAGRISVDDASAKGLRLQGSTGTVRRVIPSSSPRPN